MVNFLSSVMKCETFTNQHDTSVEQRKNESPTRIEPHDPPNTGRALYPLSYENYRKQGHLTEFTRSLSV